MHRQSLPKPKAVNLAWSPSFLHSLTSIKPQKKLDSHLGNKDAVESGCQQYVNLSFFGGKLCSICNSTLQSAWGKGSTSLKLDPCQFFKGCGFMVCYAPKLLFRTKSEAQNGSISVLLGPQIPEFSGAISTHLENIGLIMDDLETNLKKLAC